MSYKDRPPFSAWTEFEQTQWEHGAITDDATVSKDVSQVYYSLINPMFFWNLGVVLCNDLTKGVEVGQSICGNLISDLHGKWVNAWGPLGSGIDCCALKIEPHHKLQRPKIPNELADRCRVFIVTASLLVHFLPIPQEVRQASMLQLLGTAISPQFPFLDPKTA